MDCLPTFDESIFVQVLSNSVDSPSILKISKVISPKKDAICPKLMDDFFIESTNQGTRIECTKWAI